VTPKEKKIFTNYIPNSAFMIQNLFLRHFAAFWTPEVHAKIRQFVPPTCHQFVPPVPPRWGVHLWKWGVFVPPTSYGGAAHVWQQKRSKFENFGQSTSGFL